MRIISGSAGGVQISCPKGVTRPTSDRVREALFSILGGQLEGVRVLDLYAGSGALGLEALSRGAVSAVFVDQQREACRVIEANILKARLRGGRVQQATVETWLKRAASSTGRYDLIFADPPYRKHSNDTDFVVELVKSERLAGVLARDGRVIIETQCDYDFPESRHFSIEDRRVYGKTILHFLIHRHEEIVVEETPGL